MIQLSQPSLKPTEGPKSFLSIPPLPLDRNLRVLDLASPGSAAKGYSLYQGLVDVKAISHSTKPVQLHSRSRIRLSWEEADLPSGILSEPNGWYDHIHLHMMTGWLNRAQINKLFGSIHSILQPGSLFFLSYDTFFFENFGEAFSPAPSGLCRDIIAMLTIENFAILSSHYRAPLVARKDEQTQQSLFCGPSGIPCASFTSPPAQALAHDLGLDLSNPWLFLSHFSNFHQFAISFLIAQKLD